MVKWRVGRGIKYSDQFKRQLVSKSRVVGVSVPMVTKKHGIRSNRIYAHVRRDFYALYESLHFPLAGEAVLRIRKLYDVETQEQGLPTTERVALPQKHTKPIFNELENSLKEKEGQDLRKNASGQGYHICAYAHAKGPDYLDNCFLKLNINAAVHAGRHADVRHKDYLFMGFIGWRQCKLQTPSILRTKRCIP